MDNPNYSFRPKMMKRYGTLAFSEYTIQCLSLTENTYVKLGIDNTCNVYLNISSVDNDGAIKLKKYGKYF